MHLQFWNDLIRGSWGTHSGDSGGRQPGLSIEVENPTLCLQVQAVSFFKCAPKESVLQIINGSVSD